MLYDQLNKYGKSLKLGLPGERRNNKKQRHSGHSVSLEGQRSEFRVPYRRTPFRPRRCSSPFPVQV